LLIINDLKLNCDLIFNANFYQCGVNYTDSKFVTDTPGVVDTGRKFGNGVNNTSGK
jgi:hypothetical protein